MAEPISAIDTTETKLADEEKRGLSTPSSNTTASMSDYDDEPSPEKTKNQEYATTAENVSKEPPKRSPSTDNAEATRSDLDLIQRAEKEYEEQRYFVAAECLENVSDQSLLEAQHRRIIEMAKMASKIKDELMKPHPEEWKKQGETHGKRDTMIYYKIAPDNAIVCKVETPIESSLLVPLLSVLNESQLYETWMPTHKFPKLGMSRSEVLKRFGRGHQVLDLCFYMPFPLQNRQSIQHGFAVDSIEADGCIIIKVEGMDTGKHFEIELPEPEKGYKRVDFDAGFLVRSCPPDHPLLAKSKHKYPEGEKLLMISFLEHLNLRVSGVPIQFINFFARTGMGQMWGELLKVAEDVRSGKRPAHKKAIEENAELYGWAEERVQVMFDNLEKK